MSSKIVSEHWFTQAAEPATIGIIVTEDLKTKERKCRIGTGFGSSEIQDIQQIKVCGARVDSKTLRDIADLLDGKIKMMTDHAEDHRGAQKPESD